MDEPLHRHNGPRRQLEQLRYPLRSTWKDDKYFQFNAGSAANPVMEYNGLRQIWGQATYHYLWGGDDYNLWPIPLNEIQMNPNIQQNPGW